MSISFALINHIESNGFENSEVDSHNEILTIRTPRFFVEIVFMTKRFFYRCSRPYI